MGKKARIKIKKICVKINEKKRKNCLLNKEKLKNFDFAKETTPLDRSQFEE